MDQLAHMAQINPAQHMFHRADRGRPHRQRGNADGGKAHRLDGAACILATKAKRRIRGLTALHDLFEKAEKADIQRVVAAAHALVLAVGGKEKLL